MRLGPVEVVVFVALLALAVYVVGWRRDALTRSQWLLVTAASVLVWLVGTAGRIWLIGPAGFLAAVVGVIAALTTRRAPAERAGAPSARG